MHMYHRYLIRFSLHFNQQKKIGPLLRYIYIKIDCPVFFSDIRVLCSSTLLFHCPLVVTSVCVYIYERDISLPSFTKYNHNCRQSRIRKAWLRCHPDWRCIHCRAKDQKKTSRDRIGPERRREMKENKWHWMG